MLPVSERHKSENWFILICRKPVISLDKIDENIAAKHSSADEDVDNKTDTNEEDVGSPFEMINTVYVWHQAARTTHYNIKLCSIKILTSCIKVVCKIRHIKVIRTGKMLKMKRLVRLTAMECWTQKWGSVYLDEHNDVDKSDLPHIKKC